MTIQANSDIDVLRAAMAGRIIEPTDATYDDARRVWNAAIDARPAVIAQCASSADVVRAVRFAADNDLEIAVRSGAHSMSGQSVVDDGLVIDLSLMRQVDVDPAAERVRVAGGALLADLDAATQAHALAVPAGLVSHTGVAGLTLGGGMGWLTRKAGLTIDNLLSAELVTADGAVRRADRNENPDLFWALQGGGGNFGVVTELELRLHPVGPMIQLGLLFFGLDDGPAVLRLARDTMTDLPRDLNIVIVGLNAPPAPFVPEEHHFRPGYALVVVGFGAVEEHERLLARLRGAVAPQFEVVTPMPYVALQQLFDEGNAWGSYCYEKSAYLEDLSDEVIEVVTDRLPAKGSPMSMQLFYRLDGAYCDVGEDETAFGGARSPRYTTFIVGVAPTPELLPGERRWVRGFFDALAPYAAGAGTYVNAMTERQEERVRAAYGPTKYARLERIKAVYDPGNIFHRNINIRPASTAA